jgi:hypothetical protein
MTFAAPNAHVRSILMNNLCDETIYNPSAFFPAPPWRLSQELESIETRELFAFYPCAKLF